MTDRDDARIKSRKFSEEKRASVSSGGEQGNKVPKKFIDNWRHACDRTKDRTKELLKKWRVPQEMESGGEPIEGPPTWSEHVWTAWVSRYPSGEDSIDKDSVALILSPVQKEKLRDIFVNLLDMDSDGVISCSDFDALFERFRHFADWSKNSTEYHRLKEIQRGFIEYFLLPPDLPIGTMSYESLEKAVRMQQLSLHEWFQRWDDLLRTTTNFLGLPLWLQIFPHLLFQVINKSGSGFINQEELGKFYTSVVGLTENQLEKCINPVYDVLTSNGSHQINDDVYRLSFANMILGKYPNGPGQYLLCPMSATITNETMFPIDYKALACKARELETYSPKLQTDRRSVVV